MSKENSIKNAKLKTQNFSKYWIYGKHAVLSAIKNPKRNIEKILITQNAQKDINIPKAQVVHPSEIDKIAKNAVHQGVAALVEPLPEHSLDEIDEGLVLILDQITDPHNIGAILRSSAAFGVKAVIATNKNFPRETGVMAKSASGALDLLPIVKVSNVKNSIDVLKKRGFWVVGLDGSASDTLEKAKGFKNIVLVAGAEGKGLRKLTMENCDLLVKIPINSVESLNVSNAVAISLYHIKNL